MIDAKVLLEFAKDLKQLVEDFEEEMEILADRELMKQIRENKEEKKGEIQKYLTIWRIWRRNWDYELQIAVTEIDPLPYIERPEEKVILRVNPIHQRGKCYKGET